MKKTLWAFLLFAVSSAIKGLQANQGGPMELTRLKMSLVYVRSIKTVRLLFMVLLGMGVCLVLLFVSLVLFHITLFLYAPWSVGTKMLVGLLCSAVYLSATFVMFSQIFASGKWLSIFHADAIMEHLHKKEVPKDTLKPAEKSPVASIS